MRLKLSNEFSKEPVEILSLYIADALEGWEIQTKTARYVIDKNLRWQIRDYLDHQNITERMVYPGMDGLSQWLGRHYFVRDDKNARSGS